MATRRKTKTRELKPEPAVEPVVVKTDEKKKMKTGTVVMFGWGLLLVGGLAHMLPGQMEPLLKLAQFGISVQMIIGVLSVLTALNFLLGDE